MLNGTLNLYIWPVGGSQCCGAVAGSRGTANLAGGCMIVDDNILLEKLLQVEVANKQVMELTKRLAALNAEISTVQDRISTLARPRDHIRPGE